MLVPLVGHQGNAASTSNGRTSLIRTSKCQGLSLRTTYGVMVSPAAKLRDWTSPSSRFKTGRHGLLGRDQGKKPAVSRVVAEG